MPVGEKEKSKNSIFFNIFFLIIFFKMNAVNGAPNPAALSKAEKKKFNAAIIAGRFAQEECRFEGNMMHVKQEQV